MEWIAYSARYLAFSCQLIILGTVIMDRYPFGNDRNPQALVNDYWLIRRPSVWCVRTTLRGRVYPPPTSSLLTPWPGNWPAMMMIGDHRSQLRVIGDHRSLWASSTKANSKSPRANAKRKHKKQDDAGRIVTTTLHVMHFATRFHVYKGV